MTEEAEVLSNLCHLEQNKINGEADDLVQSKDPNPVISANAASGSSPRDVDVFASIERFRGGARLRGPSTPTGPLLREGLAAISMTGFDSCVR